MSGAHRGVIDTRTAVIDAFLAKLFRRILYETLLDRLKKKLCVLIYFMVEKTSDLTFLYNKYRAESLKFREDLFFSMIC